MSEPRADSAAWLECLQAAATVCAAEAGYMGAREMGGSPGWDPRESLAAGYVAAKADEFYALLQRRAPSAPPAEQAGVPPAELSTADALEDPPSVELGAAAVAGATEPAGPPELPCQDCRAQGRAFVPGRALALTCAQLPCPCRCHTEQLGPPVPEARIGWWAGTDQRAHAAILGEPLAHYLCSTEHHKRDERFTARQPTHEERCPRCALRVELTPSPRIARDRVDWVADTSGSFHAYDTNGLPRPAPCGAVRRATGHAEKSPPVKHCCVRCLLNIDYPEGRIADGKA